MNNQSPSPSSSYIVVERKRIEIKQTLKIPTGGNLDAASITADDLLVIRTAIAAALGVPLEAIIVNSVRDTNDRRRRLRGGLQSRRKLNGGGLAIDFVVVIWLESNMEADEHTNITGSVEQKMENIASGSSDGSGNNTNSSSTGISFGNSLLKGMVAELTGVPVEDVVLETTSPSKTVETVQVSIPVSQDASLSLADDLQQKEKKDNKDGSKRGMEDDGSDVPSPSSIANSYHLSTSPSSMMDTEEKEHDDDSIDTPSSSSDQKYLVVQSSSPSSIVSATTTPSSSTVKIKPSTPSPAIVVASDDDFETSRTTSPSSSSSSSSSSSPIGTPSPSAAAVVHDDKTYHNAAAPSVAAIQSNSNDANLANFTNVSSVVPAVNTTDGMSTILSMLFFVPILVVAIIVIVLVCVRHRQQRSRKDPSDILLQWIMGLNNFNYHHKEPVVIAKVIEAANTTCTLSEGSPLNAQSSQRWKQTKKSVIECMECAPIESPECRYVKESITRMEKTLKQHLQALSEYSSSGKVAVAMNQGISVIQQDSKKVINVSMHYLTSLRMKRAPPAFTETLVKDVLPAQLLTLNHVMKWRLRVRDLITGSGSGSGRTSSKLITSFLVPDVPMDMVLGAGTTESSSYHMTLPPPRKGIIKVIELAEVRQALEASLVSMTEAEQYIDTLKHFHASGREFVTEMFHDIEQLVVVQIQSLIREEERSRMQCLSLVGALDKTSMQLRAMLSSIQQEVVIIAHKVEHTEEEPMRKGKKTTNEKRRRFNSSAVVAPWFSSLQNDVGQTNQEKETTTATTATTATTSKTSSSLHCLSNAVESVSYRLWISLLSEQRTAYEVSAIRTLQSMWRRTRIRRTFLERTRSMVFDDRLEKEKNEQVDMDCSKRNVIGAVLSEMVYAVECHDFLHGMEKEYVILQKQLPALKKMAKKMMMKKNGVVEKTQMIVKKTQWISAEVKKRIESIRTHHHERHLRVPQWKNASRNTMGYDVTVLEMKIADRFMCLLHAISLYQEQVEEEEQKEEETTATTQQQQTMLQQTKEQTITNDDLRDKRVEEERRTTDTKKYRRHFLHIGVERIRLLFKKGLDHISLPEEVLWRLFEKLKIPLVDFKRIFHELW